MHSHRDHWFGDQTSAFWLCRCLDKRLSKVVSGQASVWSGDYPSLEKRLSKARALSGSQQTLWKRLRLSVRIINYFLFFFDRIRIFSLALTWPFSLTNIWPNLWLRMISGSCHSYLRSTTPVPGLTSLKNKPWRKSLNSASNSCSKLESIHHHQIFHQVLSFQLMGTRASSH